MLLAFDDYVLDPERRELRRHDEPLKVDALVIDLLAYLASRPDELVTHDELIAEVWGGRAVADNVVSVCMAKLRKALDHRRGEHEVVVNVYGRGYRFVRPVRRVPRGSQPPPAPGLDSVAPARPFVGRALPMARLEAALGETLSGRGRLCALLGEPGIGKTRLAETLEAQSLAKGVQVAWGRSRDLAGSLPLWPWVQIAREVLTVVTVAEARARLGESFVELSRLLPELGTAPDPTHDASSARYRTSDAVCRLLALAAERAPWVVVLDDLQRGDAATLGVLAYLIDELARMRVLVLCTVRNTEPELPPEQQRLLDYALGHRNAERIELSRLSAGEVADYTAVVLGRPDTELAAQVFARSEGNPFFMTELLRDVSLGLRGEPPRLSGLSGTALELPRQRVRSLGPDALGVLQHAAVIGRSFELPLLATAAGLPPATVLELLEEALAIDVVVAAPGELGRFAFDHDLLREVLLDALPAGERAAIHLRVADALEQQAHVGKAVAVAELAHHRLCALPQGDAELAAHAAERAALQAIQAAAFGDAAALLRSALAALDLAQAPAAATRARLHYMRAQCMRAFDAPGSFEALGQAARLARAHGLHDTLVLCGLSMVGAPGVVMVEGGRATLEDALAGLPPEKHALRALALCHLSWCAPVCFDRERAQALVVEATQEAERSGDAQAQLATVRARIHLNAGPCQPVDTVQALAAEGTRLARSIGPVAEALWRMQRRIFQAVTASQRGDRSAIEQALGEATQEERVRYPELAWHLDRVAVVDRLNRGELADMGPRLTELRQRAERLQLFAYERVCGYDATIWLSLTNPDWERLRASFPRLAPLEVDPPSVLGIKLRASLAMGHQDSTRAIVAELARHGFDKLACDRDYLSVLAYAALAVSALGDATHAASLAGLLGGFGDRVATDMSMHTAGSVAHALGLLQRLLGRCDEAVQWFERAVAHNDEQGLKVHALDSRLQLAEELLAADAVAHRGRIVEHARWVASQSAALGLPGHAARARALGAS